MTANPEPEAGPLRSRMIGCLHPCDDVSIAVEHVYEPEGAATCDHDGCGNAAHDPGMIGLIMSEDGNMVSALLDPAEALLLADRLQRAASLVLESGEDAADIEREAAKYTASS